MFKGLFPRSAHVVDLILTDATKMLLCCPLVAQLDHYMQSETVLCVCVN